MAHRRPEAPDPGPMPDLSVALVNLRAAMADAVMSCDAALRPHHEASDTHLRHSLRKQLSEIRNYIDLLLAHGLKEPRR